MSGGKKDSFLSNGNEQEVPWLVLNQQRMAEKGNKEDEVMLLRALLCLLFVDFIIGITQLKLDEDQKPVDQIKPNLNCCKHGGQLDFYLPLPMTRHQCLHVPTS